MSHRLPAARTARGFTLVELMVAMVLGLLVVGGVLSLYLSQQQVNRTQAALDTQTETMSSVSSTITRELRRAGFGLLAPEAGIEVVQDGVMVRYRRPGDVDDTELLIQLDRNTGTIIASRDNGNTPFPLHPVGGVAELELECVAPNTVVPVPCVAGANPVAMQWNLTLAGAPNRGVAEREVRVFATSRNALIATNGP